MHDLILWD